MGTTRWDQCRAKAVELLAERPDGLKYSQIVRLLHETYPDFVIKTINSAVWNLDVLFPDAIYKPARGVYRDTRYRQAEEVHVESVVVPPDQEAPPKVREVDFYEAFANWLISELEECTKAIPLGGNRFRDKWGTPDVLGIREARRTDIIKPPLEIVSAEIKIDRSGLIVAFGQACAYKIFSHRSYIVIPTQSQEEDVARLDVLCRTLGIGLILFDATNAVSPNFWIRVRAAKHEPDLFYLNKYMKLVEDELFS